LPAECEPELAAGGGTFKRGLQIAMDAHPERAAAQLVDSEDAGK
jgi:hypothetical protein